MVFDPLTELKLNLDNLKKTKSNLEEELNEVRANIEKYELAIEKLEEETQ